jgi:hypothetical protein
MSQSGSQQASDAPNITTNRKVHVVVVAVPHFKIDDYNSDDLAATLNERCSDLGTYFTNALGKDNVEIHPYCKEENTTREALRKLFSITIPGFSADTVTLIFIMSHGESVEFRNEYLKNDLELITSDTNTSDEAGDSKGERLFSSILFGSELMPWLERAPKRSTILVFLDTCHAGAAASRNTSLTAAMASQFQLQYLVIGSSLSQNKSYAALFTKDLLDMWHDDGCLNQSTLPNEIYSKMKTQAALQNSEGLPYYIVSYNGPLCLGNFGKDRRLLFIFAGQDARDNPFQYTVKEASKTKLPTKRPVKEEQLDAPFLPIPLDARKYTITVRRGNKLIGEWPIDLTAAEHQTLWIDTPNPEIIGQVGEKMIDAAKRNGSSDSEISNLITATAAAYESAGLQGEGKRVLMALQVHRPSSAVDFSAFEAFLPPDLHQASLSQSAGNFRIAASQFEVAARQQVDPNSRHEFAKQAYISALAAKEVAYAKTIREEFGLGDNVDDILNVNFRADKWLSPFELKAAGLAATLDGIDSSKTLPLYGLLPTSPIQILAVPTPKLF